MTSDQLREAIQDEFYKLGLESAKTSATTNKIMQKVDNYVKTVIGEHTPGDALDQFKDYEGLRVEQRRRAGI